MLKIFFDCITYKNTIIILVIKKHLYKKEKQLFHLIKKISYPKVQVNNLHIIRNKKFLMCKLLYHMVLIKKNDSTETWKWQQKVKRQKIKHLQTFKPLHWIITINTNYYICEPINCSLHLYSCPSCIYIYIHI